MKDWVQIWIDGKVTCFVNPVTNQVMSAKHKLLKPLKHKRTPIHYYIIQYQGNKVTKSIVQLLRLVNEKLQSQDRQVS